MTDIKRTPQLQLHSRSGLYFPDDCNADAGYEYMIRRVTDVDVAVEFCRKTAVAVQAGGNIGLWPLRLAKFFSTIHTFEPVPHIFGALSRNIQHTSGLVAYNRLLSAPGVASVPFSVRPGGVSRVDMQGTQMVEATTIDQLELPACDAIFLDVEGHELEALKGAVNTIKEHRPVITLEVWDGNLGPYSAWLARFDYTHRRKVHGDHIFVPA